MLLIPALISGVLFVRVAGVRRCYCLAAMKRAGSQVCELEPLSCVPARNTRARQSGVGGGRSIIWQQNPDLQTEGEDKALSPLPDLSQDDLSKEGRSLHSTG